jgi:hypothetical protein
MKLLTIADLTKALNGLVADQIEVTLNLAYHSMIHGNVEPLAGFKAPVVNVLHAEYKAMVCATFDKKSDIFVYNKPKAIRLCTLLGLVYSVTTFDEFVNAVKAFVAPPAAVKTEQEKKDAAIKRVEAAMGALLGMGLTTAELIALANKAQAK